MRYSVQDTGETQTALVGVLYSLDEKRDTCLHFLDHLGDLHGNFEQESAKVDISLEEFEVELAFSPKLVDQVEDFPQPLM